MSALALPALGLASRAAQALPALFADLAQRSPPADVHRLESTGHAEPGKGAASYISDALCDDALLLAHPRFVFRTANARIFRLLPTGNSLSAEQGGASGSAFVNDQPAIQAAIDYAHAAGARTLRFENERYRVDCPLRTSPALDKRAEDGHPLVIRRSLTLEGCAPGRTVFDFRGIDGEDPESDWQLVPTSDSNAALAVWRGGGIYLQGDAGDPGKGRRRIARLEIARIVLRGNRRNTGAWTYPADPVSGDGWDVSDRGMWVQDCYVGEIRMRDCDITGFKGELFYLAGTAPAVEKVVLEKCRFATSNGSAFNPSVDCEILASDCSFGDCFQAQEDIVKTRAVYRNCTWHDCDHMGLGSGPANGVYYALPYPTRDEGAPPPVTLLDNCEFRAIRSLRFQSWVRGRIRTIDTTVSLNGEDALALRDTDLEIEAWLDRANGIHALALVGTSSLAQPVPGAPPGIYKLPPANIRLHLSHHRTELARANGREWLGSYWTGYLHRSCQIHVEGDCAGNRLPNGGTTPISMPLVTYERGRYTSRSWARGWFKLPAIAASGEITPCAPYMTVQMANDSVADMTLRRTPTGGADHGYSDGQRIRIVKHDATGSIRFVKGASSAFAVRETRVLDNAYDWIEFSYNRDWQRWEEEGFFSDA